MRNINYESCTFPQHSVTGQYKVKHPRSYITSQCLVVLLSLELHLYSALQFF